MEERSVIEAHLNVIENSDIQDEVSSSRDAILRHVESVHAIATTLRGELAETQKRWGETTDHFVAQTDKLRAERDTLARRVEELEKQARDGYHLLVNERVDALTAENGRLRANFTQALDANTRDIESTLQARIDELTALLREASEALKGWPTDFTTDDDYSALEVERSGVVARVDAALAGGGEKKHAATCPAMRHGSPGRDGYLCNCSDTKPVASEQFWKNAEAAAARTENWPQWKKDGSSMSPKPVAEVEANSSGRPYNKTAIEVAAEVLQKSGAQFSAEKVRQLLAYVQELERLNGAAPSEAAESERRTLFGLEALTGGEWLESQPPTRHLDEEGARTLAMKSTYLDGRERRIVRVDEVRTVLAATARITKEPSRE